MNRFDEALKEKPSYTDDGYEGWAIHFHDTITYALKLAAKLEQGPSEGMIKAALDKMTSFTTSADTFITMLEQAKREIE